MIHRRGYIPEFDGFRGVAILLVMAFHIWRYSGGSLAGHAITSVAGIGWAGVDVFFVLSGFLITGILLDSKGRERYWRNFFIRRSLRIFPLYYAVMTALVVGAFIIDRFDIAISDPALATVDKAWINYLYLTNFVKAFWGANVVPLDIAWSLAVEEQFYILYPFIVRWASRRTLMTWLMIAVVSAPVFRYLSFIQTDGYYAAPYVLPYCRMDALAIGGLAAILVRNDRDLMIRIASRWAWPLVIVALTTLGFCDRGDLPFVIGGYSIVAIASGALMLRALSTQGGLLSRAFSARWLVYIGKISYGLYLLHIIARAGVDALIGQTGLGPLDQTNMFESLARLFVIIAVAVLMASVSYFSFERPILRLKTRWAPTRELIAKTP